MIQKSLFAVLAAGMVLTASSSMAHAAPARGARVKATCPVMKATIAHPEKSPKMMVNNIPVYFCCPGCDTELRENPAKFLTHPVRDVVNGKSFKVSARTPRANYKGRLYLFSSPSTLATFKKSPAKYVKG